MRIHSTGQVTSAHQGAAIDLQSCQGTNLGRAHGLQRFALQAVELSRGQRGHLCGAQGLDLIDHYRSAVELLAANVEAQTWVLRTFELVLLREVGFLPDLAHEGSTLAAVEPQAHYVIDAENGLRLARAQEPHTLTGEQALALQAALDNTQDARAVWQACASCAASLRRPLRTLLHYHSGVQVFKTRQLMLDVQALNRAPT